MELGVKGFGAQHYLESVTKNMRRGLRKRAEQGLVIGGRTFGYDHVKLPGKRGTDRRINDAQAALVREVFEMYACGDSPKQIARALNDRRLPPDLVPGGKDMTRWSRHQVRETLQHILYTGKVVTTWDGERLEIDRPDLLIIKDDLWQATRQRFAQLRAEYARSQHGRLLGRPSHSIDSDYLLVGMIQCAICDGSMTATGRKRSGKKRHMYYQCLAAHDNRRRPCDNFVLAPMELARPSAAIRSPAPPVSRSCRPSRTPSSTRASCVMRSSGCWRDSTVPSPAKKNRPDSRPNSPRWNRS